MAETTTLYRLFAADGQLLYVGITWNAGYRLKEHAGDKPWWPSVASATFEHFATREEALAAERRAIRFERPVNNIALVPNLDPGLSVELTDAARELAEWTAERDRLIREAVAAGGSLREVGAAAGLTHTAVKFIAHGRPAR